MLQIRLVAMLIPFVALVFAMTYVPLFGWSYAFVDYTPGAQLRNLRFVGPKYFNLLFSSSEFPNVLRNTLVMSGLQLLFSPVPMALAIRITHLRNKFGKRFVQTATSFPNFISWILMYSIIYSICGQSEGPMNLVFMNLGLIKRPINFLGNAEYAWIRQALINVYKTAGYSAIIYIANIVSINPEYYEAASIDGAGVLSKIRHITIPEIMPTFLVLFLLMVANALSSGFEQFYVFQTPTTLSRLEVLDTYTYRIGIMNADYSYSTAVGMFKTVVSLILLIVSNFVAKKIRGEYII
jgi:ABC-type polysaccharide transport system permease subunit